MEKDRMQDRQIVNWIHKLVDDRYHYLTGTIICKCRCKCYKYVKGFYGSNGVTSFSVAIILTLYRDNKGYI